MFDNVLRLEFRKQRQDFLVVVGFALAVILCFVLEALIRNRNVGEVLKDVFVFVSMGLVLVLALTSANSARNLRTDPYKAAEELLPFSPFQKTLGAYLVNVVYLGAGSSLFLLSLYLFNSSRNINWVPLSILLVIHFHLLCFLFSYWLNQTVLAVIISGLLVWCESVIIGQKVFSVFFLTNPDLLLKPLHSFWSFLSFVISISGALVALWIVSTRIERQRRVRWMPGILASIILLAGSFLLFIDLISSSYATQKRLMPGEYYYAWIYEMLNPSPTQERTGAYFFTLGGSIVHITPQGRQVLREVPLTFLPKVNWDLISIHEADQTGFWALIKNEDKYEIWNSRDGKELKLYTQFKSNDVKPYYILNLESNLYLFGYQEEKVARTIIKPDGLGVWQITEPKNFKMLFVGKIRDEAFKSEIKTGKVAVISSDLGKITRNLDDGAIQEWTLPGKAEVPRTMGSVLNPAFYENGEPIFALPVTSGDKTSIFICKPDGSVVPLWNKSWPSNEGIGWRTLDQEGYAWVRRDPRGWKAVEAFVIGKDGFVYPPLKLPSDADDKFYAVDLLKMNGSNLWMMTKDSLQKVDLRTGKILESFKIFDTKPKFYGNIYRARTKEGVYFVRHDRINLIDWNGKVRDLGPARLN